MSDLTIGGDVIGAAGIDTADLKTMSSTTTSGSEEILGSLGIPFVPARTTAEPMPSAKPITNELILKTLNDIKTQMDNGFANITMKISEMGMKQSGGRGRGRGKSMRKRRRYAKTKKME